MPDMRKSSADMPDADVGPASVAAHNCTTASQVAEPVAGADPADIERLFREHNTALLRFVATKLGSEQEAKEVAQEAYVRLLRLNHPEAISYLRAFLFKTAANLALDRLRARGRRPPMRSMNDLELAVFHLSPERQLESKQTVEILGKALAELPKKCRQAFLLHRVHGLSRAEVAARLGLRERMVRMYMARALEHLRLRLDLAQGEHPTRRTPTREKSTETSTMEKESHS